MELEREKVPILESRSNYKPIEIENEESDYV